jgi:hypothetical protein
MRTLSQTLSNAFHYDSQTFKLTVRYKDSVLRYRWARIIGKTSLNFRCLKIPNFTYSLLFVKCETWRLKTVFYFVNDAKPEGEYVR